MRVIHYTTALKRIASKTSVEEAAWRLSMTQTTYYNQMNGDYELARRSYNYLKKVRALYEETTGREEEDELREEVRSSLEVDAQGNQTPSALDIIRNRDRTP